MWGTGLGWVTRCGGLGWTELGWAGLGGLDVGVDRAGLSRGTR